MNKIPVQKRTAAPRHSIVYHYRKNKPKSVPTVNKRVPKPVTKPKNVIKPKRATRSMSTKRVVKDNALVRSKLMPKKLGRSKRTKSTFDLDLRKIKSIRGVGSGKILAIFAPGPSILEAEINRLSGISEVDTMTINKPDDRVWPSDYWMFCDRTQYNRNKDVFHKFTRTIINTDSIKTKHPKQVRIKTLHGKGFSLDMTKGFHIGRSTTFSSMQVAAWMDYDKIFIFGLDMCRVGKKLHSYGTNPDVPEKIREKRFKNEADFYDSASKIMKKELRDKYYICSSYNPWPFVNKFNRLDQKEAVDYILNCVKEMKNG